MPLNYAFGFSMFLFILVGINIYFFYTLNILGSKSNKPSIINAKLGYSRNVFDDIYEYLNYLPSQYKIRNVKCNILQKNLFNLFNVSKNLPITTIWSETENVS